MSSVLTRARVHVCLCAMQTGATPLLTDLLKAVSRSFYLTMRVLPASVRPQISLAYLLARTTDTIADTELVPVSQRLEALAALRKKILGESDDAISFTELAAAQPQQPGGGTTAEHVLLERAGEIVSLLANFSSDDQKLIRDVLSTITSGQELDLKRFGSASAQNIVALSNDVELDDYTYRVAGCVGEFWTKICRAHVFPHAMLDDPALLREGVCFGQGLQLVNILRDMPRDLRQGRCYLPLHWLASVQLTPNDLLQSSAEPKLRPVFNKALDMAEAYLFAGWEYTNALPRSAIRVRLACAWPILIGVKTIARLRKENPLNAERCVKVSRAEVKRIMAATVLRYPFAPSWRRLFDEAKR